VKQGKRNWFDIATTLWAVTLVVVAVMWVSAPAFAGRGRGGGIDCMGSCVELRKCRGEGGCETAEYSGGECFGECGDGSSWDCGVALET